MDEVDRLVYNMNKTERNRGQKRQSIRISGTDNRPSEGYMFEELYEQTGKNIKQSNGGFLTQRSIATATTGSQFPGGKNTIEPTGVSQDIKVYKKS